MINSRCLIISNWGFGNHLEYQNFSEMRGFETLILISKVDLGLWENIKWEKNRFDRRRANRQCSIAAGDRGRPVVQARAHTALESRASASHLRIDFPFFLDHLTLLLMNKNFQPWKLGKIQPRQFVHKKALTPRETYIENYRRRRFKNSVISWFYLYGFRAVSFLGFHFQKFWHFRQNLFSWLLYTNLLSEIPGQTYFWIVIIPIWSKLERAISYI